MRGEGRKSSEQQQFPRLHDSRRNREMPLDLLNQAVMEIDVALMSSQDADEAGA